MGDVKLGIDISEEYVGIANKRMEIADQMIQNGYKKDYTPEVKSGSLSRKEVSEMSKAELIELVLKSQ